MATTETPNQVILEKADIHREALALFYDKRWQEAIVRFERILGLDPEDGPSAWFRNRCREFCGNPPSDDDWQVLRMKEK
jgi:adenylate cyclase